MKELLTELYNRGFDAGSNYQVEGTRHESLIEADILALHESLTKRVAELEDDYRSCGDVNSYLIRKLSSLQSQLAWTPVADGLPTEPGEGESYEFTGWGHVNLLRLSGEIWEDSDGEYFDREGITEDYTHFRRITLPEAT